MRTGRLLARFLRKTLIVSFARLFFFSRFGIRLLRAFLLTKYLLRNIRSWPEVIRYAERIEGTRQAARSVFRYYRARADGVIWTTLSFEAWDSCLKHHDFGAVDDLRAMLGRGKGLLVLGMHYGPKFTGYLLARSGLNPAILATRANIPDLDGVSVKRWLPNESVFRATYDGMLQTDRSERSFIRLMRDGRPGMIMNDVFAKKSFITSRCLDIDYPFAVFPFRLALKHSFPVAVIWFSEKEGGGYRLNAREIDFRSVEEGAARYGALLEEIVRADPYLWEFGPYYSNTYFPHPP